jgi:NADH dehydrogenase FAD-containing subunit
MTERGHDQEVVVIGAGPTGVMAALELHRRGVPAKGRYRPSVGPGVEAPERLVRRWSQMIDAVDDRLGTVHVPG